MVKTVASALAVVISISTGVSAGSVGGSIGDALTVLYVLYVGLLIAMVAGVSIVVFDAGIRAYKQAIFLGLIALFALEVTSWFSTPSHSVLGDLLMLSLVLPAVFLGGCAGVAIGAPLNAVARRVSRKHESAERGRLKRTEV